MTEWSGSPAVRGASFYAVSDGNGNVSVLVDADSAAGPVETLEYGPFGRVVAQHRADGGAVPAAVPSRCPFGFSSKYLDAGSGLLYFGHRYYSVDLGRWLCRDPLGEKGGANLYAYCQNDPVNAVDPLGLAELRVWTTWTRHAFRRTVKTADNAIKVRDAHYWRSSSRLAYVNDDGVAAYLNGSVVQKVVAKGKETGPYWFLDQGTKAFGLGTIIGVAKSGEKAITSARDFQALLEHKIFMSGPSHMGGGQEDSYGTMWQRDRQENYRNNARPATLEQRFHYALRLDNSLDVSDLKETVRDFEIGVLKMLIIAAAASAGVPPADIAGGELGVEALTQADDIADLVVEGARGPQAVEEAARSYFLNYTASQLTGSLRSCGTSATPVNDDRVTAQMTLWKD
jgi:RHS repeat-associated protein